MRFKKTKYITTLILFAALATPYAHAAQLYFYPDNLDVVAGGSFVVEVRLDTEGESVNAIDISGNVTGGIIESVTTANSLIDIFLNSSAIDKETFNFAGGTPGGFVGSGIIGRLNITTTMPGSLSVTFDESSQLLSGSGESLEPSDILLKSVTINALQPSANPIIITSKSHPNQNNWYNKENLQLHWDLEDGVDYSYLVSLDPAATPDDTPDKPQGTLLWLGDINIEGLDEGIYYFTLKRVGEESIARFRAMIDTTPPEWLGFETNEGVPETNYKDFVSFIAKDELSGINHYEVTVDNSPPKLIIAPYLLPEDYLKIKITAFDNAGNAIDENIIGDTQKNIIVIYIVVGLIVLGSAIVAIKPIRERLFTKES